MTFKSFKNRFCEKKRLMNAPTKEGKDLFLEIKILKIKIRPEIFFITNPISSENRKNRFSIPAEQQL